MRRLQYSVSKVDQTKSFLFAFVASTPLLLVYLFIIDAIFLIISIVLTPLLMLISFITCSKLRMEMIQFVTDKAFETLFGMQEMDVVGFRRLRTVSQLTFETLAQILLQSYIYTKIKDSSENIDISVEAILFSIVLGLLHCCVEILFIFQEKFANKTSLMHYTLICFNGKFGFVPFIE